MYTVTEALARYTEWDTQRSENYEREEDDPVSSSTWEYSDDEGVELAHIFADLLRQPIKIWSLTVASQEGYGRTATTSLHSSEEACWDELIERYNDEDWVLESPVDIVSVLEENQGMSIYIDVHEVTR